jgi:hypothetical protein
MAKSGFGAAQNAVEEAKKSFRDKVEYNKFQVKTGEDAKRVRFLILDGDDSVLTFREHWTEMKNTWKCNFACPNEELGDDNCIVCSGKKDVDFLSDQRKNAHILQLINRATSQVEVWKFSPMAMATLLENLKEHTNITDRDYSVQFVENDENVTGIKARYLYLINPIGEPAPMSQADNELASTRYDLKQIIPVYDEENIKRIMAMKPSDGKPTAKAAVKGSDFLNALGGTSTTNMATDLFKNITSAAKSAVTTPVETSTTETQASADAVIESAPKADASSSTDDFMKLLNDLR